MSNVRTHMPMCATKFLARSRKIWQPGCPAGSWRSVITDYFSCSLFGLRNSWKNISTGCTKLVSAHGRTCGFPTRRPWMSLIGKERGQTTCPHRTLPNTRTPQPRLAASRPSPTKYVTRFLGHPDCYTSISAVTNRPSLLPINSVFRCFIPTRSPFATNGTRSGRPLLALNVTYPRLLLHIGRTRYIFGDKSPSTTISSPLSPNPPAGEDTRRRHSGTDSRNPRLQRTHRGSS